MLSQKEAVFNAINSVFADNDIGFEPGEKVSLTKELRADVTEIVAAGMEAGDVTLSETAKIKYPTSEKIKAYVSGMVGNWLTKDPRLNGGDKYQPKNPGSRTGQGDAQLRETKKLLKKLSSDPKTDPDTIDQVEAAIAKRIEELKVSKGGNVEIDVNHIPEELAHLLTEQSA